MRIILQNKSQKERLLCVPNALLLNRLTAFWIARKLEKRGIQLPYRQIRLIKEQLQNICRQYPDWVLMEAEDAKGEKIKIKI